MLKKLYAYAIRYPLATALTVLLFIGTIVILATGKKIQIGGILGLIWGKENPATPDVKLLPPTKRVDETGKPIVPGTSDSKGYVQVQNQIPIEPPGILSDPNKIVVQHPERGKEVLELPTGVKNEDVKTVIEISPKVYQIANNDFGVDVGALLQELNGK